MNPSSDNSPDDVIVIGGGPAGTTTAALLAEKGWKVRVLEKCRMPRYHIGESLMPFCWFTLDRLGVLPQIEAEGFTQKLSVNFVSPDGAQSRPFYFFQHNDHPSSYTWQVTRSRFDQILWDNAATKGVHMELVVCHLLADAGVPVRCGEGESCS
jgi:2-polyprenyl-6-methoxyphenol hydroxylase-like FAD-dependent oxidoreductase